MDGCGRSKANLSVTQKQVLIERFKQHWVVLCQNAGMECLKGGEDVGCWVMSKFCQGSGEVSLSKRSVKHNYSHCNPKGLLQFVL